MLHIVRLRSKQKSDYWCSIFAWMSVPPPVYTNLNTNEVQPSRRNPCTERHLWFPYNYAPIWRRLTTNCVCLFLCVSVCVHVCVWEKTMRLLFTNVRTISVELNHGCLLARIQCYRNGMPGSDITFLVVFHHKSAKNKQKKALNLLKYVAVVLTEPDCQQRRPLKLKTHRCLLYALCFYSNWVCGQFMGLSEVPSEKQTDLEPAPGHLVWTFKRIFEILPSRIQCIISPISCSVFLGADLRPVLCRAHDNGEVFRVGRRAGQRVNSSECTPGLDRPLCNYHSISLTYI